MSLKAPFPPSVLVSAEGLDGPMPSSLTRRGGGFPASNVPYWEIEIQVSLRLFQAALFPVLGLEWERGPNPQHCFSSTRSLGVGWSQSQKHSWGRLCLRIEKL